MHIIQDEVNGSSLRKKLFIRTHYTEPQLKRNFREKFQTFVNNQRGASGFRLQANENDGFIVRAEELESSIRLSTDAESSLIELKSQYNPVKKKASYRITGLALLGLLIIFVLYQYNIFTKSTQDVINFFEFGFYMGIIWLIIFIITKYYQFSNSSELRKEVKILDRAVLAFSHGELSTITARISEEIVKKKVRTENKAEIKAKGKGGQKKKRKRKKRMR